MTFHFALVDQDRGAGRAGVHRPRRWRRSSASGLLDRPCARPTGSPGAAARRSRHGWRRRSSCPRGFSAAVARGTPAHAAGARQRRQRRSARWWPSRSRAPTRIGSTACGSQRRPAGAPRARRARRARRRRRSRSRTSRPATQGARRRPRSTRPGWPSSSSSSPSSSASPACSTSAATARWRACSSRRCATASILAGKLLTSLVLGVVQHGRARASPRTSRSARTGATRSVSRC